MEISKYPIDFDAVTKGQEFSNEDLENITGKKRGTDDFTFAVMGLRKLIIDKTGFTVKMLETGLRILTDPEASEDNWRWYGRHRRGTVHRHLLMQNVDVSALNPDQARRHEARLLSQSRTVQAILRSEHRRQIEQEEAAKTLEAAKRQ